MNRDIPSALEMKSGSGQSGQWVCVHTTHRRDDDRLTRVFFFPFVSSLISSSDRVERNSHCDGATDRVRRSGISRTSGKTRLGVQ